MVSFGGDIPAVGDKLDQIVLCEVVLELFIHILEDLLLVEHIFFALVEDEGVEEVDQFYRAVSAVFILEGTQQLARLLQSQPSLLFLLLLHHIIFNIPSSSIPRSDISKGCLEHDGLKLQLMVWIWQWWLILIFNKRINHRHEV